MASRCSVGAMSDAGGSLLLGDGLHRLSDHGGAALSVDHDQEALVIVEVSAGSSLGELLGEGGRGPLSCELSLLGGGKEGASAGAASDVNLHSRQ